MIGGEEEEKKEIGRIEEETEIGGTIEAGTTGIEEPRGQGHQKNGMSRETERERESRGEEKKRTKKEEKKTNGYYRAHDMAPTSSPSRSRSRSPSRSPRSPRSPPKRYRGEREKDTRSAVNFVPATTEKKVLTKEEEEKMRENEEQVRKLLNMSEGDSDVE